MKFRSDPANARDIGADAVLVITPYYARPTQEGLFASAHVRPPLVGLSDPGQHQAMELLRVGSPVLNTPVTTLAERG